MGGSTIADGGHMQRRRIGIFTEGRDESRTGDDQGVGRQIPRILAAFETLAMMHFNTYM